MKIEDRKAAMIEAIRSVSPAGKERDAYILELADKLEALGAFIPPVKVGETVCAALDSVLGEPPSIEPWEVKGYGIEDSGSIYLEDRDGEQYLVDSQYCCLKREDAEEWLKRFKEQDGDNGSEGDEDDGE